MREQVDRRENMCWINNRHERSVDLRRIKGKLETALSLYLAGSRREEKKDDSGALRPATVSLFYPLKILFLYMDSIYKQIGNYLCVSEFFIELLIRLFYYRFDCFCYPLIKNIHSLITTIFVDTIFETVGY